MILCGCRREAVRGMLEAKFKAARASVGGATTTMVIPYTYDLRERKAPRCRVSSWDFRVREPRAADAGKRERSRTVHRAMTMNSSRTAAPGNLVLDAFLELAAGLIAHSTQ